MSVKITEKITYGLKVILSTKAEVQIEPSEVPKVMEAIASGGVVKVKQGIINPSYVVAVVEDEQRRQIFLDETRYDNEKRGRGMKPLKDILDETLLLSNGNQNGTKAIQSGGPNRD